MVFPPNATLSSYTLWHSGSTPENYAFPLTQKVLHGHPELAKLEFGVTDDGRFGAVASDYAIAQQLVIFAKAHIKGAKPRIICETVSMRPVPFSFEP
jgi:hypothetical protein